MRLQKKHILLIIIMLLGLFLRAYNPGEISGGDDSEYARVAMLVLEGRINPVYIHTPDEPVQWRDIVHLRPMAVLPFTISILIFGNTNLATKFLPVLLGVLNILLLYLILKKYYSIRITLLACFFFAVSPFAVAFSRIGVLNSFLCFYLLIVFYLVLKGFKEGKVHLFYIAGLFVLLSQLTTQFRGLVPLAGFLPYLYYKLKERKRSNKRLLIHLIIAMAIPVALYFCYILLPILWGDYAVLEKFLQIWTKAIGGTENLRNTSIWTSFVENEKTVFLTPFLGLIFVPALFGMIYCLKNFRKCLNNILVFSAVISPLFFILHKQIAPIRQDIYVFAYAALASIALIHYSDRYISKKEDTIFYIISAMILFFAVLIKIFPVLFPAEWAGFMGLMTNAGMNSILSFYSMHFILVFIIIIILLAAILISIKRLKTTPVTRKKTARVILAAIIILNITVPLILVVGKEGIYYRPTEIRNIADYISDNMKDETYSCVAGIDHKILYYYTKRPCAFWVEVDEEWLKKEASGGNLSYFVINLHEWGGITAGLGKFKPDGTLDMDNNDNGSWSMNYYDKYEWLMENAVDITGKTGLADDNRYFRLYEYRYRQRADQFILN